MNKIHWNYVKAFTLGLFFLLAFSRALVGYVDFADRSEKFLFIYEDPETAECLAQDSEKYGIVCSKEAPGETAELLSVREADSMSYLNVTDYFRAQDGKIETDLIKWLLRLCMAAFIVGLFCLLLKGKSGLQMGITLFIWFLYLRVLPGSLVLPRWALPSKWSDFEGWAALKDSIGRQLFSMVEYQDIPLVGECREAVSALFLFLPLAFLFLYLYDRCCKNLKHEYLLHLLLSAAAVWFYIRTGNPGIRVLLYFFPCYALSRNLTGMFRRKIYYLH